MAKTSIRRHHANRLLNKWKKYFSNMYFQKNISFGMIYSHDPIDCGKSNCKLCSWSKIYDNRRKKLRVEEKNSFYELLD